MTLTLDQLMKNVAAEYAYDDTHYPALKTASAQERAVFTVRHSALHFAKTAGQVAAVSEGIDHGAPINQQTLQTLACKSFINTLKMAEIAGLSAQQLIDHAQALLLAVNEKYAKKEDAA